MVQPLTTDQIRSFDTDGYLHLRKWIPEDLLRQLQQAADAAIQKGLREFHDACLDSRVCIVLSGASPFVIRINDLVFDPNPVFMDLLGSPYITEVAESLAGHHCLPTYEALVIKNKGDDQMIEWHRDLEQERTGRLLTVGVYLDESVRGNGALRIIPASQNSPDDVCELREKLEAGQVSAVEIETEPGDVLIHDVMALHASGALTDQVLRRTIYFEFRPEALVHANPLFSPAWQALRRRQMELARERWVQRGSRPTGMDGWSAEELEFIAQLKTVEKGLEAGHYCYRPLSE